MAAHGEADCGRHIDGDEELLAPGRVLLIGEWHGMRETQAWVEHLACVATKSMPVTIAFEWPWTLGDRVDVFLRSAGEANDRAALLQGRFWTVSDGRTSTAMVELLDRLRRLRQSNAGVRVLLLDMERRTAVADEFMAARLVAAHREKPSALIIAITGNNHSRVARGSSFDPAYEGMGVHIAAALPDTRAFKIGFAPGNAWYCYEPTSCGEAEALGGIDRGRRAFIETYRDRSSGFDGLVYVGVPHASPPALPTPSPDADDATALSR